MKSAKPYCNEQWSFPTPRRERRWLYDQRVDRAQWHRKRIGFRSWYRHVNQDSICKCELGGRPHPVARMTYLLLPRVRCADNCARTIWRRTIQGWFPPARGSLSKGWVRAEGRWLAREEETTLVCRARKLPCRHGGNGRGTTSANCRVRSY